MPDKTNQSHVETVQTRTSRFAINFHFRREALMMIGFVVALLVLGFVTSMIGPWVMSYLETLR
jgi:hypothetical protein